MAGYSGTPLIKKLGIKPGMKLLLINPPENYSELLGELPPEARILNDKTTAVDFIHLFLKKTSELENFFPSLIKRMKQEGMIWVSWYKKSSGIKTDVTEDVIRDFALFNGLVDIKVCAVDEQWSALKLVIRKEQRKAF